MNYATVCSGIGSPEVAWSDLWGKPIFTSEIEKFPSAALKHYMPDVPNYGDMTKYKEWPDHDIRLICGGTPCQSFSVAGLRKGMDDPRGNLTLTFLGLLARYNPRWLIWENVPGVFSSISNGESDFGRFLSALAELGYSCAYRVLDAQYFGVPQRRRRVFVVGYLGDWRPAAAVLFEQRTFDSFYKQPKQDKEQILGPVHCRGRSTIENGVDQVVIDPKTQRARFTTPLERERQQGFPDDYTRIPWRGKPAEQCPDGPRYKALGNSIAVPVIKWLGERIKMVDDLNV